MGTRLFGVETEYALAGFDVQGERLDGDWVGAQLLRAARAKVPCLPGAGSSGVFLASGHRAYVDAGSHVEVCTPECTTPWEVVRYTLAGDRLLATLAADVVAMHRKIGGKVGDITLTRCNVDYGGSSATWGCHESYLYRGEPELVAREIVPHFVSRLVYTGAGGFDNRSSGARFLLSPRVAHLVVERSSSSTAERGIFHRKDESLANDGFRRLHVLCGESVCSRLAAWLKLGVTALVVALIEADVRPGRGVRLRSPVEAMQAFASDPTCRVEVQAEDGRMLSAIAIQRHYLAQVEAHLGADFLPPWAAEVCRVWGSTLDELTEGPDGVAAKLDWAIKLTLFRRHVARRGFDWATLPRWTAVADGLADVVIGSGRREPTITAEEALALGNRVAPATMHRLGAELAAHGLAWGGLRPFLDLKHELCEIDTRYAQVGASGIFQALERAGVLEDDGPGVGEIASALETPPAVGRARVRGETIRALARRQGAIADWHGVWDKRRKRMLDLGDPFVEVAEWRPWQAEGELDVPWFLRRG